MAEANGFVTERPTEFGDNAFGPNGNSASAQKFVAPSSGTLDLTEIGMYVYSAGQSDSPCIGAGADLGTTYDDALDPGSSWPDNVTAVDQDDYDDGTPGWEIGAYVYDSGTPSATASFSGVSFQ